MEEGRRDLFWYSVEFLPLNANATEIANITIQADSAFLLTALTGDVRTGETSEANIETPAINVLITDQGTGRTLMDRAQRWNNIIGTGQRPYILPMPKQFSQSSTIAVQMTEMSGNNRYVRLTLHGYKIIP